MPNPKHTHNFIQQFHDFTDKYDFINEQIPYIQTNEGQSTPDTWYPSIKKVDNTLAIRLSLIVKLDGTYLIYLENFMKEVSTDEWSVGVEALTFNSTCKISFEDVIKKWKHTLVL